jgi:hypothetical protein
VAFINNIYIFFRVWRPTLPSPQPSPLKGEGVIPHESPSSESLIPIFSSPLAGEDLGEG